MAGKYNFLCDEICKMIECGKLLPGDKAPSENDLIATYGLSGTTIKTAYNKLGELGVIIRRRGSGTYVTENARKIVEKELESSLPESNGIARAVHILVREFDDTNLSLKDEVNLFVSNEILKGVNDALIKLRIPYYQQYVSDDGIDFSNIGPHDGVIIIHGRTAKNLRALKEKGLPFVVVNYPSGFACNAGIEADDASGVYEAMEYLVEQGCKSVAYLGPLEDGRFFSRLSGFRQGIRDFDVDGIEISCDAVSKKGMKEAMNSYLEAWSKMPDGIFAATDHRALICMEILKERGIKVPEDVAVIGFDDSPSAAKSKPELTTVRKPRAEMGKEAADMLLELFKSSSKSKVIKKALKTTLIVRESAKRNK